MTTAATTPMTHGVATSGLRLEQAPPLAIVASFFVTAPFGLIAAGALLGAHGSSLLWTRFAGPTAALTHAGTLGFLTFVMLGALYQMIPVVVGSPVALPRVAHGVHAGLVLGASALILGFATGSRAALVAGAGLLALVLLLFLVPVAIALFRAQARGATVAGMRASLAALFAVAALGVTMAHVRGVGVPAPAYSRWVAAHLTLGLLVWIGGLITAVSFQVMPMFYLTPAFGRRTERLLTGAMALTLLLVLLCVGSSADPSWIAVSALPGALAAWLAHPLLALRALGRRRRRRSDPSLDFWRVGLGAALCLLPLGGLAVWADDSRWPVLFGWVLLWGWAAMIVHGMLMRIVPFLVWFHRFARRAGREPVPSMRQLLPERVQRIGFALHAATLVTGVAAVTTGLSTLARLTGLGLALTGAALLLAIVRPLRR